MLIILTLNGWNKSSKEWVLTWWRTAGEFAFLKSFKWLNLTVSLYLLLLVRFLLNFPSCGPPFISLSLFSNSRRTYGSRPLSSNTYYFCSQNSVCHCIVCERKRKVFLHIIKLTWILSHLYLNLLPLKKMLLLETVFIWLDFVHLSDRDTKTKNFIITKHLRHKTLNISFLSEHFHGVVFVTVTLTLDTLLVSRRGRCFKVYHFKMSQVIPSRLVQDHLSCSRDGAGGVQTHTSALLSVCERERPYVLRALLGCHLQTQFTLIWLSGSDACPTSEMTSPPCLSASQRHMSCCH